MPDAVQVVSLTWCVGGCRASLFFCVLGLLTAGCGSTVPTVVVVFERLPEATRAEEVAVGGILAKSPLVAHYAFISKKQALARATKPCQDYVGCPSIPWNPFRIRTK